MVTIYGTVEQLMDAAGTTTIMPGADKIEHREIGVSSMGMAKLTLAQCREIIAMRGTMPQKVIAAKYGVSESAVSRLLKWVA